MLSYGSHSAFVSLLVYIPGEGRGRHSPLLCILSSLNLCHGRQMDHSSVLDIRRIFLFGFLLFTLVYRKDK